MEKPTQLHDKTCAFCRKPITKGQAYWTVDTPDGPKTVHAECMDKGSKQP